jgi:hypothetical protein
MPTVRFEPTILEFERAKTVHALDSETTVIDLALSHLVCLYAPYCSPSELQLFSKTA